MAVEKKMDEFTGKDQKMNKKYRAYSVRDDYDLKRGKESSLHFF